MKSFHWCLATFTLLLLASCSTQIAAPPWQEITTTDLSRPPSLLGRWKAETVPTGYWIIDRYADGRYASKRYHSHDMSKPHEIVIEWGRWKSNGRLYSHVRDGTNSAVLQRFVGKWYHTPILDLSRDRFDFETTDQHRRFERRVSVTAPLPDLKLPVPRKEEFQYPLKNAHGVIIPPVGEIPAWVYHTPAR